MTDRNKFEEMLELLINEDREGAEALFHEIVVEKSRDIYQSILEAEDEDLDEDEDEDLDESDDEDLDESDDEDLDESDDEDLDESDDEDLDEMFGLDEFEMEADPMAAMGGDATDDMMGDIEMPSDDGDMDDMDGGDDVQDRVEDLEDALEALKAEFDALMSDESDDMGDEEADDMGDMDDMDDEEGDDEDDTDESYAFEAEEEEVDEGAHKKNYKKSESEQMREYVEKVAPAKMGDNGTNAKSIVAGKNDMGGTTANILRSDTETGTEANKGQLKGNGVFKGTAKVDNAGNVNVPGAKGATKMASRPGHGAEKKGKPETADKSAGSMLNGAPRRAK